MQPIFLVAQNIRSLFNVGALFRSADIFGVEKIYLCGYTGTPPRKEISKTALGAEQWTCWEHYSQTLRLVKRLKKEKIRIVALETCADATPLNNLRLTQPTALIIGNEVNGITSSVLRAADDIVKIPMIGRKESLNVSVAAGIGLYQLRNA